MIAINFRKYRAIFSDKSIELPTPKHRLFIIDIFEMEDLRINLMYTINYF